MCVYLFIYLFIYNRVVTADESPCFIKTPVNPEHQTSHRGAIRTGIHDKLKYVHFGHIVCATLLVGVFHNCVALNWLLIVGFTTLKSF